MHGHGNEQVALLRVVLGEDGGLELIAPLAGEVELLVLVAVTFTGVGVISISALSAVEFDLVGRCQGEE